MSYQQQIALNIKGHGDVHDITDQVVTAVNSSRENRYGECVQRRKHLGGRYD